MVACCPGQLPLARAALWGGPSTSKAPQVRDETWVLWGSQGSALVVSVSDMKLTQGHCDQVAKGTDIRGRQKSKARFKCQSQWPKPGKLLGASGPQVLGKAGSSLVDDTNMKFRVRISSHAGHLLVLGQLYCFTLVNSTTGTSRYFCLLWGPARMRQSILQCAWEKQTHRQHPWYLYTIDPSYQSWRLWTKWSFPRRKKISGEFLAYSFYPWAINLNLTRKKRPILAERDRPSILGGTPANKGHLIAK